VEGGVSSVVPGEVAASGQECHAAGCGQMICFRPEVCSVRQMIRISSSAKSWCAVRGCALQLDLQHLLLLFGRSRSLWLVKEQEEEECYRSRQLSLRTRLRSPNPDRRTHLTGKGSHDHWGYVRLLSGKWYPSFKALWASTPLGKVGFAFSSAATGIGGEWRIFRFSACDN
jgi:hypothetical protein